MLNFIESKSTTFDILLKSFLRNFESVQIVCIPDCNQNIMWPSYVVKSDEGNI